MDGVSAHAGDRKRDERLLSSGGAARDPRHGYVTRCFEAALWAFAKSTCFEDGALLAVNLGEDADTTGAVYGQLAGAYYGVDSVPQRWRSKLAKLDVLESFARRLHEAAESFA